PQQRSGSPTQRMAQQMRKRATYIRAEGDAAIESTEYAARPEKKSGIAGVIASINPFKARPAAPIELPDRRGPFVSRFRVAGPQIGIDLVQEHFGVEGAGNLLIQDHRLPSDRRAPVGGAQGALLTSTGLGTGGPNARLCTGHSWLTCFSPHNLAGFDGQVVMALVSGRMAITDQWLAHLWRHARRLPQINDLETYMTCDNMYVE